MTVMASSAAVRVALDNHCFCCCTMAQSFWLQGQRFREGTPLR